MDTGQNKTKNILSTSQTKKNIGYRLTIRFCQKNVSWYFYSDQGLELHDVRSVPGTEIFDPNLKSS